MTFAAIVVAAGRGVRFGGPKQLIELAGRPLVAWSFAAFAELDDVLDLVVATEAEHVARVRELAARHAPRARAVVVTGGATRQESARLALDAVPARCEGAFIHDGARPLVLAADVRRGMALVRPGAGAVLAAPVIDTIKVVQPGTTRVVDTLDRHRLWAAQTPQFGTVEDLVRSHAAARADGFEATDDAMLLERAGIHVEIVAASGENFKVTMPGDRELAAAILRERGAGVSAEAVRA